MPVATMDDATPAQPEVVTAAMEVAAEWDAGCAAPDRTVEVRALGAMGRVAVAVTTREGVAMHAARISHGQAWPSSEAEGTEAFA